MAVIVKSKIVRGRGSKQITNGYKKVYMILEPAKIVIS
jgi:hypothetical protein